MPNGGLVGRSVIHIPEYLAILFLLIRILAIVGVRARRIVIAQNRQLRLNRRFGIILGAQAIPVNIGRVAVPFGVVQGN